MYFFSQHIIQCTNVHSVSMHSISLMLTDSSWRTGHSCDSCTSCACYWYHYYRPWADKTQLPVLHFLLLRALQHASSGGVRWSQKQKEEWEGPPESGTPFPSDSSSYYCHDVTSQTKQQQKLPCVCLLRIIIWAMWREFLQLVLLLARSDLYLLFKHSCTCIRMNQTSPKMVYYTLKHQDYEF